MLDTGCTRTCARNGEKFLENMNIENGSAQLLCANNQIMGTAGKTNLKIKFNESFAPITSALIVDNLSLPLIIGLDIIKSLEFAEKSPFVTINKNKLRLVDRDDLSNTAYVAETINLEPYSDNYVKITNRNYSPENENILIAALDRQKKSKFTINHGIYKNEEKINIIITNKTSKRLKLNKNLPICSIEYINIPECNAVYEVPDKITEYKEVEDFQLNREEKAMELNFSPEIGSYGNVDSFQESRMKNMIYENRLSFSMGTNDLGKLGYFRFTMPLIDESETAHQPPRPIPIHLREKVDKEIENWQSLGIIQPTQSGFNIPLIILKKGDGSLRISLDARKLNTILKPDRYPLPHMKSVFTRIGEKLSNAKECYISSVDFLRGYWQIQTLESDAHKTSFSYKNRHFEAKRMLYGTSTAPSCFARIMNLIFGEHPSIVIYLDDLMIIDNNFEDHMASLQFVFDKCRQFGIILNGKKTRLCQSSIEFLGHLIDQNGIKPMDKHIQSVKNFPEPLDKKTLKRFLGLVNYNLKFVKKASIILSPLYKICSTKNDFIWKNDQQEAFDQIKEKLQSSEGLFHRDPSLPLILVCDASKDGCGGTLYQSRKDKMEVISYSSKKFTRAEERRSMREKELLGLSYAVRANEYYLLGFEFVIVSDHKSLLYLYREHLNTNLDAKLLNIFFYLQQFNFSIIHRPGNSEIMASADCISRLPKTTLAEMESKCGNYEIPDKIFAMMTLPDETEKNTNPRMKIFLRSLAKDKNTLSDPEPAKISEIKPILEFEEYSINHDEMVEKQSKCDFIKNAQKKLNLKSKTFSKRFELENNLLYRKSRIIGFKKRLVLPKNLGSEFLQYTHTAYGHCGSYQLQKIVGKLVFIPQIKELAANIAQKCVDCIRMKPRKMLKPSLIKERHFEDIPFQKTHMDLYDLGKADQRNKRYLVTICDSLTGYADGIAISNKTDRLVSEAIMELILRYGISGTLVCDNGREFGVLTKKILDRFRIRMVNTSAYMSRSNGKVERIHREITSKMKTLKANHTNWSCQWSFVKFLINNLPKTSLDGLSAAEALYGRSLYVPFEVIPEVEEEFTKEPFIKALNEYLTDVHLSLMKFQYDKYAALLKKDKNGSPTLEIDSQALIWKPDISGGKLGTSWSGPFVIVKRISKDSYLLKDKATHRTYRRNIRHLRPLKFTEPKEKLDPLENEIQNTQTKDICNEFDNNFLRLPHFGNGD